jgi:hypothetical protein
MSSTLTAPRPVNAEIHPELVAIERKLRSGFDATADPFITAQSYNISQCDSPETCVQLPYPNDGGSAWEFVSQTGDPGCVDIEGCGEYGMVSYLALTWKHPGQTTVTYRSTGMGYPGGHNILLFTIFACG